MSNELSARGYRFRLPTGRHAVPAKPGREP